MTASRSEDTGGKKNRKGVSVIEEERGGYETRPCDTCVWLFVEGGERGYSSSQESSDDMTTCWRTGTWLGTRRVSPQVAVST